MSWFCGTKEFVKHDYNEIISNVLKDGTIQYRRRGIYKLHNVDDKPAIIFPNGIQHWYKDCLLDRDFDRPAIDEPNGKQCWYKNGLSHRDNDLPAIKYSNGTQIWCQNGKYHSLKNRCNQAQHRKKKRGNRRHYVEHNRYDHLPSKYVAKKTERHR